MQRRPYARSTVIRLDCGVDESLYRVHSPEIPPEKIFLGFVVVASVFALGTPWTPLFHDCTETLVPGRISASYSIIVPNPSP